MKFFINPGHSPNGNPDPGALNERLHLRECDIALQIGRKVRLYLQKAGCQVLMMQSDNLAGESPGYPAVCTAANGWEADAFLSLHCNSFVKDTARGVETYCYCLGGEGARLAACLQRQVVRIYEALDVSFQPHFDRGVKARSDLIVLHRTAMPAALLEMGFISSDDDCLLLVKHQDELARAIAVGCTDYWCGRS